MPRCSAPKDRLILAARPITVQAIVDIRGIPSRLYLRPLAAWSIPFLLYVAAMLVADADTAFAINNVVWFIAPIAAAISAWRTQGGVDLTATQSRGWKWLALACAVWALGQLVWSYDAYLGASPSTFPAPSEWFYLAYAAMLLRAVGLLSDSTKRNRFTLQHLGNLGLMACCLAVTIVIAFLEPIAAAEKSGLAVIGPLAHCTFVALTFFAPVYYLWTQRWVASWIPMLLIAAGTGVYSLGNFVYFHALLTQRYQPADWVNASWTLAFCAFGLAASVRRIPVRQDAFHVETIGRRARQLEAAVPAMLIILIVLVGMSAAEQVTPRVLVVSAALLLLFAFILGAREAWIQAESQRLTRELRTTNELLLSANRELQQSEARVRDLNAHLEERVADRMRELQSAYEELEGFAYAVAHDLKAPLRAIDGFGQLLDDAMRDRADAQGSGYLSRIRRGAMKMAALIDDLLAYSRIERRSFACESIELAAVVSDAAAEFAAEIRNRAVQLRLDVPPMCIRADREAVALVMRNLLQNALKFTRFAQPAVISVRARLNEHHVQIVVHDNGIGFDMQYHEQIFKLFHRLHRDDQFHGTGIGLALVRKALERMNGRVHAESKEGEGATFIVELPLAA